MTAKIKDLIKDMYKINSLQYTQSKIKKTKEIRDYIIDSELGGKDNIHLLGIHS